MGAGNLILVTRPKESAQAFIKELQAHGFETLAAPVLEIVPQDFMPPDVSKYGGLIFTSANAVRIFAAVNPARDIPAFCVGQDTASAARSFGYSILHNVNKGGKEMVGLIIDESDPAAGKPLLHVRGAHGRDSLRNAGCLQG